MKEKNLWIHFSDKYKQRIFEKFNIWDVIYLNRYLTPEDFAETIEGYANLVLSSESVALDTLHRVMDHVNISGFNPLVGKNRDALGPRFPDMSYAYKKESAVDAFLEKTDDIIIFSGSDKDGIQADHLVWQSIVANHQSYAPAAWIFPVSYNLNQLIKRINEEA